MNKTEIQNLIYNYHWMRREVDRLENIIFGYSAPQRSWGVAQYGIDAAMPKGSSGKSKIELESMDAREDRAYKRLSAFEQKVCAVEKIIETMENQKGADPKDEQILTILDCMIDGMSYRAIAAHLGLGRKKIYLLKEEMLNQVSQRCQFIHELNFKK